MKNMIQNSNRGWVCYYKEIDFTDRIIYMKKSSYFVDKNDSFTFLKEMSEKYEHEIKHLKKLYGKDVFTFSEYLDYWYKYILSDYASDSYRLATRWAIYNLILPSLPYDKILSDINSSDINLLLERTVPLSKMAAYSSQKILRVAFNDALLSSRILDNPMESAIIFPCPKPSIKLYNKVQLKKFLAEAMYSSIYLEIILALFLGLRMGEIRGLTFDDFDKKNKTVSIKRQAPKNTTSIVSKITKDNIEEFFLNVKTPTSVRTLKVPDFIWNLLEKRRLLNEGILLDRRIKYKCYKNFVCISGTGNIKTANTIKTELKKIYVSAALPPISMHKFRHLCATMLFEHNVPLKKISKFLGHSSVATTFNIYCDIFNANEDLQNFIEQFDPNR